VIDNRPGELLRASWGPAASRDETVDTALVALSEFCRAAASAIFASDHCGRVWARYKRHEGRHDAQGQRAEEGFIPNDRR
jgi:hypothetical protein